MTDLRERLHAHADAFEPAADGLHDLRRRHRRRRVRSRGVAAGVGVAVGLVAAVFAWRIASLEAPGGSVAISPATVDRLTIEWSRSLPGAVGAVAGDEHVFVVSQGGEVLALDPESGRIAWSDAFDAGIDGAPAAGDGLLAVQGSDGVLRVYAQACSEDRCDPMWTADTGAQATTARIAEGVVAIASESGRLSVYPQACSDPCAPRWTAQVGGADELERWLDETYPLWPSELTQTPAVGGGLVWDASDGFLRAFPLDCWSDGGTCAPLVEVEAGRIGRFTSSPAVIDGRVFVASISWLQAFDPTCVDAGTCAPVWRAPIGNVTTRAPVGWGSTVIIHATYTNAVFAYPTRCDPDRGVCLTQLWRSGPERDPARDPIVAGGVVFSSALDRKVEAFPVACRQIPCPPRFVFRSDLDIAAVTAWGDRVLAVLTDDGTLRAFAATSGDRGA